MKKTKIVIPFNVNSFFNVWINESIRYTFYLFLLLEKIEGVDVHMVNFGTSIDKIKSDGIFGVDNIEFTDWDSIKNNIDIFIDSGYVTPVDILKYLSKKKTKIVKVETENKYINDSENILYPENKSINTYGVYNEIWVFSQHCELSLKYLEEIYKMPVRVVPFLWSTIFMDLYNEKLKSNGFQPKHGDNNRGKVSIIEPNTNTNRLPLIPLLTCERVYNKNPELIKRINILNSEKLMKNEPFLNIIKNLNIFKKKIIKMDGKYNTPYILSKVTDVVFSYQKGEDVNQLYFDTMYGNYPLVHNSNILKGIGYFYDDNDLDISARSLTESLNHKNINLYKRDLKKILSKYDIENSSNIRTYKNIINDILT